MKAPFIGISRHRIDLDGPGVCTLAAFHGCPLRCRYCLNRQCFDHEERCEQLSPEELYLRLSPDNLYFIATGGGVCFGGGEPLMRTEFIGRFRELCGKGWHITIETSLNVPPEAVEAIAPVADSYIIDIKDCDPGIYQRYTGRGNATALANLRRLLSLAGAEALRLRVPLIPGYNTPADNARTIAQLHDMGIANIEQFNYITNTDTQ